MQDRLGNVKANYKLEFYLFFNDFCLAKFNLIKNNVKIHAKFIIMKILSRRSFSFSILLQDMPLVTVRYPAEYTPTICASCKCRRPNYIEKSQAHPRTSKDDGQSHNQLARWVATKESHASKIQKIMAEYFLTQRIKSSSKNYEQLLKGAHSVMVAAMKCKQSTEASAAMDLKSSILAFQKIYGAK